MPMTVLPFVFIFYLLLGVSGMSGNPSDLAKNEFDALENIQPKLNKLQNPSMHILYLQYSGHQ